MRLSLSILLAGVPVLLITGCAGPEEKLGRGIRNATEFVHLNELGRSMEQTALNDGPDTAYTTGVIRGFNRSVVRTAMGVGEILTFPIPTPDYGPWLVEDKANPVYPDYSIATRSYPWGGLKLPENASGPDSYKRGLVADPVFNTVGGIGFQGGELAPGFPNSRFKVFDNY